jgi:hypothetical protein
VQFLCESLLLAGIGGAGGVMLGIAVTGVYATAKGWPPVVPGWATFGGFVHPRHRRAGWPVSRRACQPDAPCRGIGLSMTRQVVFPVSW